MSAVAPNASPASVHSRQGANGFVEPPYVCDQCRKSFTRSEHLQRHVDSHFNNKSWHCEYCGKDFGRRDVLNRHFKRCGQAVAGARTHTLNFNRTCVACSQRKVKCNSDRPCARCRKHCLECMYPLRGTNVARSSSAADNERSSTDDDVMNPPLISSNSVQDSLLGYQENQRHQDEVGLGHQLEDVISMQNTTETLQGPGSQSTHFMPVSNNPYADATAMFQDMDSALDVFDWLHLSHQYDQNSIYLLDETAHQASNTSNTSNPDFLTHEKSTMTGISRNSVNLASPSSQPSPFSVQLSQINPLENHRTRILQFLTSRYSLDSYNLDWMTLDNVEGLLKRFFSGHQKHTPILHLPHWNVGTTSTPLLFSMILIALSCLPSPPVEPPVIKILVEAGYKMAVEGDSVLKVQELPNHRIITLQALQAMVFLAILDKLMLNGRLGKPTLDFTEVINFARTGQFFEEEQERNQQSDANYGSTDWRSWALSESRRRTSFVIFAFDAFLSLLDDRLPSIAPSEMRIFLPSPDNLFLATSQEEWSSARRAVEPMDRIPFSIAISVLFTENISPLAVSPSLLGDFTLLHGILAHTWEVRKIHLTLGQQCSTNTQRTILQFVEKQFEVIRRALDVWYSRWTSTLNHPLCSSAISPGLYKDRSLVYWYLCGILTLPNRAVSSNRISTADLLALPIKVMLKKLVMRYDRGQLNACAGDFVAARELIDHDDGEDATRIPIGSLLYRD